METFTTARYEKVTQDRIVSLFEEDLGYIRLGDWHRRENNLWRKHCKFVPAVS